MAPEWFDHWTTWAGLLADKTSHIDAVSFYLERSEVPVARSLKPEEPGNDAPPVARHAERGVVVSCGRDAERRVQETHVQRPEQRDAHLVGGVRRRTKDAVARVPVSPPFLPQSRVVCVVQHAVA